MAMTSSSTFIPKSVTILQVSSASWLSTWSYFASSGRSVPTTLAVSKLLINVRSGKLPTEWVRNTLFSWNTVSHPYWFWIKTKRLLIRSTSTTNDSLRYFSVAHAVIPTNENNPVHRVVCCGCSCRWRGRSSTNFGICVGEKEEIRTASIIRLIVLEQTSVMHVFLFHYIICLSN